MANLAACGIKEEDFPKVQEIWEAYHEGRLEAEHAEAQLNAFLTGKVPNPEYLAWWVLTLSRDLVYVPGMQRANQAIGKYDVNTRTDGRSGILHETKGKLSAK